MIEAEEQTERSRSTTASCSQSWNHLEEGCSASSAATRPGAITDHESFLRQGRPPNQGAWPVKPTQPSSKGCARPGIRSNKPRSSDDASLRVDHSRATTDADQRRLTDQYIADLAAPSSREHSMTARSCKPALRRSPPGHRHERPARSRRSAGQSLVDFAASVTTSFELPKRCSAHPSREEERRGILDALDARRRARHLRRFLHLLLEKGRIAEVEDIAQVFKELANARAGRLHAQVTAAVALDDRHQDTLDWALESERDARSRSRSTSSFPDRRHPPQLGSIVYDGSVRAPSSASRADRHRS